MSLNVHLTIDVDTGGKELYCVELYSANTTHNLGAMATEAGIYDALWRPDEIGIETAAQLIEPLRKGGQLMLDDPKRFEAYNDEKGWGMYYDFLPWIKQYLAACQLYPKARVSVSR